ARARSRPPRVVGEEGSPAEGCGHRPGAGNADLPRAARRGASVAGRQFSRSFRDASHAGRRAWLDDGRGGSSSRRRGPRRDRAGPLKKPPTQPLVWPLPVPEYVQSGEWIKAVEWSWRTERGTGTQRLQVRRNRSDWMPRKRTRPATTEGR